MTAAKADPKNQAKKAAVANNRASLIDAKHLNRCLTKSLQAAVDACCQQTLDCDPSFF